ncbi:hypothetical protein P170DRAFT_351741, partial [Aspergillus steynii IBT 23096]
LIAIWDSLPNNEKAHCRSEMREAIAVLRSIRVVCLDKSQHNMMYDRATGLIMLIGFEVIRLIKPNSYIRDMLQLWSIFAPPPDWPNRHLGG